MTILSMISSTPPVQFDLNNLNPMRIIERRYKEKTLLHLSVRHSKTTKLLSSRLASSRANRGDGAIPEVAPAHSTPVLLVAARTPIATLT